MKTLKEIALSKGLNVALNYLDADIEKNLPKIIDWVEKFDVNGSIKSEREAVKAVALDPENNWHKFMVNLWKNTDRDVLKKFFENFLVYSNVIGNQRRRELMKEHDCSIPWAILMDPTSACNLECVGCWSSKYGDKMSMDFDTLDRIIREGKEMGTYMYIFSGGEPLVRKADVIRLCEKHDDCQFLAFTNGTLIDEAFAKEMLRVKNFIPAISIEGFEEATDARRGKGTYQAVVQAMEILKKHKLPFGASCCYTSQNAEVVGSEEFFDQMLEWGAMFAWYFTYMPVGLDAATELMATAEQRKYIFQQIRKFRDNKPIFTMDFWNDGEYVNGCIAAGKSYLHINANGDIEPCAFIHYADSNIHECSLLDAYKAPFFQEYRNNQPFNGNQMRPCPLLDNPGRLADLVEASGAHSTDLSMPENARDLCNKCVEQAEAWKPVASKLWKESPRYKPCDREDEKAADH